MLGIVLPLISSACWGGADFLGGMLSRRLPVLTVVLGSQVVGAGTVVLVAMALGRPLPAALLSTPDGCCRGRRRCDGVRPVPAAPRSSRRCLSAFAGVARCGGQGRLDPAPGRDRDPDPHQTALAKPLNGRPGPGCRHRAR